MTDFPTGIVMEAIKKRLVQTRSKDGDGYDITFQIHPDDAMSDIAKWPLGTRVALVVTRMAVDGDDMPAEVTPEPIPTLLEGQIHVGEEFIWEPSLPHARAHIIVTRVDGDKIWSRKMAGGDEFWNDESRFREAAQRHSPAPVKGGRRAKMAGILCGTIAFQNWLYDCYPAEWKRADDIRSGDEADATAQCIRHLCKVDSRAKLDDPDNPEPGRIWGLIESEYRASQRGDTEDARLAQRADGPS